MKRIRLIPFCCGAGASTAGCELGPVSLAEYGLSEDLSHLGLDASWYEDPLELYDSSPYGRAFHENLPPLGSPARKDAVLWHCDHLRNNVIAALQSNIMPVTIGGDHSMAAGSIAGLAQARNAHGRIGVLWIDAHADLNTPATSPSQALHGMPVAALLGKGDEDLVALSGDKPALNPEHICYIGLRDVDPGEVKRLKDLGITAFDAETIEATGVEEVFKQALEIVQKGTDRLFLSIDLDGFDPVDVPPVGTPVKGGLKPAKTYPVLEELVARANFDVIEIAEFNPKLDGADKGYEFIRSILGVLLGPQRQDLSQAG